MIWPKHTYRDVARDLVDGLDSGRLYLDRSVGLDSEVGHQPIKPTISLRDAARRRVYRWLLRRLGYVPDLAAIARSLPFIYYFTRRSSFIMILMFLVVFLVFFICSFDSNNHSALSSMIKSLFGGGNGGINSFQ